jgi:outer membrane receptor protein involved in Fe transport
VVDAVWKWAPDGNPTRTNFKLQAEWLRSVRSGLLNHDPSGANLEGDLRLVQTGAYLQAVYQFMPRWRVGARTEWLDAGTARYSAGPLGAGGFKPKKHTLMVDFSSSEFSRVRLQFARDQARLGVTDNQLMLQYQMSLGAHGAHAY